MTTRFVCENARIQEEASHPQFLAHPKASAAILGTGHYLSTEGGGEGWSEDFGGSLDFGMRERGHHSIMLRRKGSV